MGDITIRFFNVISLKLIGEKNFDMYNPPVVAGLFNLFFLYLDLMNFIILFTYSPDLEKHSILAPISSRTRWKKSHLSSSVPSAFAGSANPQCSRLI